MTASAKAIRSLEKDNMKKIVLDGNSAKQLGRTAMADDILCLVMSGTGCEFTFTGRQLKLSIGCDECSLNDGKECNLPRVAVTVNGRFILKKVIASRCEEITVFDCNTPVTADVRIIKLSEAAFSVAEVHPAEADDDAVIAPVEGKKLKIEFIGDSITCGYGVDDSSVTSPFATCAENFMKSYAFLTAEMLGADYSAFSASGYGIISGYTHDGKRNTAEILPPYYESLGFSYSALPDGRKPADVCWDFARFTPDVIIINLGTNDSSFCSANPGADKEYEDTYVNFIKTVRKNSPEAVIVCALGIMGTLLCPNMKNACERYVSETGDRNIHTLEFDEQDGRFGYSSNWHPSEDTHFFAAEKLAEFIKTLV